MHPPYPPQGLRLAGSLAVVPGYLARQTIVKPLEKLTFSPRASKGPIWFPRDRQDASKMLQDRPKCLQETPKSPQEADRKPPGVDCVLPLEK